MNTNKEQTIDLLKTLDVAYRWLDHPPIFTVEESKAHIEEKIPVKNLLLSDNKTKDLYLVIMDGDRRLDMKDLATRLDVKKFSFAKPEVLLDKLGVTPGSVSLFSLLENHHNDVQVIVDAALLTADEVGFHPNDNTASVFIAGTDIEKVLSNTGNNYKCIEFS